MAELTPRDDIKKKVSEILKRIDRLIRAGEIDQAIREIIQAKEIDPKNVYVFAYEERLAFLKTEHEKHIEEEQTRKAAEEAARQRDEEARKVAEAELERLKEEETRRHGELQKQLESKKQELRDAEAKRPEAKDHGKPASPAGEGPVPSIEELERELREAEAELRRTEEAAKRQAAIRALPEKVLKYRNELSKAWEDGTLTPFEETQLAQLRADLKITDEEHTRLTNEVQRESYVQACRQLWSSGVATADRAGELADLRTQFQIPRDIADRIEADILADVPSEPPASTLAIIDDDVKFLEVVSETLREAKFSVRSFSTSDEAFKYLKENKPDLIISDINLETSTMGGFSFYERVRELDHLHEVPFLFLSGLTDEVLVRTGKELGVDDYLTKPFSDETLLATIRGKLKRFKKLAQMKGKKK
jgi:CheY-like chemotaxis protein